jgi:hypothetical protein
LYPAVNCSTCVRTVPSVWIAFSWLAAVAAALVAVLAAAALACAVLVASCAFWVLAVLSEMVFFYTQGRWFVRFGLNALITASFLIAAVRFLMIAELAWLWWALAIAQLLHAFSFAVHHSAAVLTIQRWFPGQAAARGQALYISVSYGVGGTSGSLLAASSGGPEKVSAQ